MCVGASQWRMAAPDQSMVYFEDQAAVKKNLGHDQLKCGNILDWNTTCVAL